MLLTFVNLQLNAIYVPLMCVKAKNIRIVGALLFVFVLHALLANAQPKFIIVKGEEYNWGEVKASKTPLETTVFLKNEGTDSLIIKQVRPGCGCTVAKPQKDILLPGETTSMHIEFNIGNSTGVISKTIRIETNDPTRPTVSYKITANIIRDIICQPGNYLRYEGIYTGKEASKAIKIKNYSDNTIHFSDVKVEPAVVNINLPSDFTIEAGKEVELIGKVNPDKPGYTNAKIKMKTSSTEFPVYEIDVHIHVKE